MPKTLPPSARKVIAACITGVALGTVFLLYTRPDFLVQLSNQIWACF